MRREVEENEKVTLKLSKITHTNYGVKKCRCGIPKFGPYPAEMQGSADDNLA
jgi:hypothetical protein